jgi:hypothetical protein
MVRNHFKLQNGKKGTKIFLKKFSSTAGKHFTGELHMWEI